MLMIRLSRIGRKKHPHYRLVIAEKARDTYGKSLEILGHYHPLQADDKDKLVVNKERTLHWLSQGAQASNTVKNLLIDAGLMKGDKTRTIGTYKNKKTEEAKPEEAKKEDAPKDEAKSDDASKAEDVKKEKAPVVEEKKEEPKAEVKKDQPKVDEPHAQTK
jgi:small subunit ribosomal protein S16